MRYYVEWIWSPYLEALEEAFSLEEMELSQHSLSSEEVDEEKDEEEEEEEVASFTSEDAASTSSSFRR